MSTSPYDNLERRELARLASGEIRLVHAQRARKLRKRGEYVWWNYGVGGYVWSPNTRHTDVRDEDLQTLSATLTETETETETTVSREGDSNEICV